MSSTDDEYEYFYQFVETVANASVGDMEAIAEYEDDERLENTNFRELALAVHPDASHVVTSYDASFHVTNQMVFTELGLCYVVNSPVSVLLEKS